MLDVGNRDIMAVKGFMAASTADVIGVSHFDFDPCFFLEWGE